MKFSGTQKFIAAHTVVTLALGLSPHTEFRTG